MGYVNKIIAVLLISFLVLPSYSKETNKKTENKKIDNLIYKILLLTKMDLSKHKTIRSWVEESDNKYKIDRRLVYGKFYDFKIPPMVVNENKLLMFNRIGHTPDILELKVVKNKFAYFYNGRDITPKDKEGEKDWLLRAFPELKPKKYSYADMLGEILFPKAHAFGWFLGGLAVGSAGGSQARTRTRTRTRTEYVRMGLTDEEIKKIGNEVDTQLDKRLPNRHEQEKQYQAMKDLAVDTVKKGYEFQCVSQKGKYDGVSFTSLLNGTKVKIKSKPTEALKYMDLDLLNDKDKKKGSFAINHESDSSSFSWINKEGKTLTSSEKNNKHMLGSHFFKPLNIHQKRPEEIKIKNLGAEYYACTIKKNDPSISCSNSDFHCWKDLEKSLAKSPIKISDDDMKNIESQATTEGSKDYEVNGSWLSSKSSYIEQARQKLIAEKETELRNEKDKKIDPINAIIKINEYPYEWMIDKARANRMIRGAKTSIHRYISGEEDWHWKRIDGSIDWEERLAARRSVRNEYGRQQLAVEVSSMSPEEIRAKNDDCSKEALPDSLWQDIKNNRKAIRDYEVAKVENDKNIAQVESLISLADAGTACCRHQRCKEAVIGEREIYNKNKSESKSGTQ